MVTPPEIQLKFLRTRQSFGSSKQSTQFSFLDFNLNLSKIKKKTPINHPPLKNPNIKTRHSRTLKQMEHASICFSRRKRVYNGGAETSLIIEA